MAVPAVLTQTVECSCTINHMYMYCNHIVTAVDGDIKTIEKMTSGQFPFGLV